VKPTDEQIEAICVAIFDSDINLGLETLAAMRAWEVIAPMVLEEAAKAVEALDEGAGIGDWEVTVAGAAARIRALKGEL
jgi:hypothetical protein